MGRRADCVTDWKTRALLSVTVNGVRITISLWLGTPHTRCITCRDDTCNTVLYKDSVSETHTDEPPDRVRCASRGVVICWPQELQQPTTLSLLRRPSARLRVAAT